jgi:ADP-ribosylglycohydrolase
MFDKILGCLIAAGVGDAMGAPSEGMCKSEIVEAYGGRIEGFVDGKDNEYSYGNHIGEITDDASQMYEMAKAVADCGGHLTVEAAAAALVTWSESYPKYYPRNAGLTTSKVINALRGGGNPYELGKLGKMVGRGTTNGAAMRVAAAGLCKPGDYELAIENAVNMCRPSHATQHAFSGACAIACGISEALISTATTVSIVKACVYGARRGEEIGLKTARKASGIRVINNIGSAIQAALLSADMVDAEDSIDAVTGSDGSIQSSVAAVLGLFLAADGDIRKTILSCANLGGDSDTNACIAGMLCGAFKGCGTIPEDWIGQFKEANPMIDFESVAARLCAITET